MNDLLQQPSELTPDKRPGLLVLSAGLATTVLTLGIVYLLGAQVMGWYVNYIIPAGAIFVGLCAGLGYGLGSWFTGAKISGRLLLMVVILQVIAYFGAQYLDYVMLRAAVGVPFSFLEYFDFVTRSFAWEDNGQPGQPFGAWGVWHTGPGDRRLCTQWDDRSRRPLCDSLLRQLPGLYANQRSVPFARRRFASQDQEERCRRPATVRSRASACTSGGARVAIGFS